MFDVVGGELGEFAQAVGFEHDGAELGVFGLVWEGLFEGFVEGDHFAPVAVRNEHGCARVQDVPLSSKST